MYRSLVYCMGYYVLCICGVRWWSNYRRDGNWRPMVGTRWILWLNVLYIRRTLVYKTLGCYSRQNKLYHHTRDDFKQPSLMMCNQYYVHVSRTTFLVFTLCSLILGDIFKMANMLCFLGAQRTKSLWTRYQSHLRRVWSWYLVNKLTMYAYNSLALQLTSTTIFFAATCNLRLWMIWEANWTSTTIMAW